MGKKRIATLCAAGLALLLTGGFVLAGVLLWRQNSQTVSTPDGYWQADGQWGEILAGSGAESGVRFAQKLLGYQTDFLTPENRAFFALIPDKGYYLQEQGAPRYDYEALFTAVQSGLAAGDITQIDLTAALSAADYFSTDSHWQQQKLQPVLNALGGAMDFSVELSDFTPHTVPGFVGAYGKHGANAAEDLIYLTSPATEAALADNFQYPDSTAVYDLPRLETDLPYDLFLSGATPLVTVTSPAAATDRELVIFRDSYASSLAPLLLGHYRKITLVDVRYMASGLLPQYLRFTDQDVLFLYSVFVADQSAMLR